MKNSLSTVRPILAAAFVLCCGSNILHAEGLVPRLIMAVELRDSCEGCRAMEDLQLPDSHVLIAGEVVPSPGIWTFAPAELLGCDEILATLAANLGTTPDDPAVLELADLVCSLLADRNMVERDTCLVKQGGVVNLPPLLLPLHMPEGSVALAGADGHVLSLGTFLIYYIQDPGLPQHWGKYAVTTDPFRGLYKAHLAIGWFSQ